MTVGRPARLAWSLAGACVALVLSSLVLLLAVSHAWDVSQYYFEDAAVAVAFALLGAVVAAHRPENPIGWLFLAIGLSGALGVVSNEYVKYTLVTAPGALPGGSVAAWLSGWTWWPAYGLVPLVLLVFPDGRLPSPRWRWAAWLAGAGVAVMTLGIAASTLGDPVRIALSEEEPGGLPTTWAY
jgi:two-component system, NarL family, sensor kinase